MSNTLITQNGIDFILSASTLGPFISLKYFLPVYDYRADPTVHDELHTSAIDVSAAMDSFDTVPTGEIIWNIDTEEHAYTLSDNDYYILSAGGETLDDSSDPWLMTNFVMSKQQAVNLYDNVPLSDQVYGEAGVTLSTNAWEVYTGSLINGVNSVPAETSTGTNRYFDVVDYYPAASDSGLKGTFKCRLSKNIGSCKFNKIALYAIQVDENGAEIGSPVLFAEAMMDNPVIKTNFGTEGFDDIVIDVQLTISTITSAWGDVFYSTSGDYWQLTPNGLYYPERVGIGVFDEGSLGPQAMLEVRSSNINQLRLTYDDTHYSDIFTDSSGDVYLSAINENVFTQNLSPISNQNYDLGSNTANWSTIYVETITNNSLIIKTPYILPLDDNTYDLGDADNRWRKFYANSISITGNSTLTHIFPSLTNTYSIGTTGAAYKNIVVNNIYSDTGSLVNIHNDVEPSIDDTYDLGKNNRWKNIRSTNGYFNDLYIDGLGLGEWVYIPLSTETAEGDYISISNPNGSITALTYDSSYLFNYAQLSIIGKTVTFNCRISFADAIPTALNLTFMGNYTKYQPKFSKVTYAGDDFYVKYVGSGTGSTSTQTVPVDIYTVPSSTKCIIQINNYYADTIICPIQFSITYEIE